MTPQNNNNYNHVFFLLVRRTAEAQTSDATLLDFLFCSLNNLRPDLSAENCQSATVSSSFLGAQNHKSESAIGANYLSTD